MVKGYCYVPPRLRSVLYWAAMAAAGAAPGAWVLAQGHTLVWHDTAKLFQPVHLLVVEALRNVRLPLWNPYEALGVPLFAQLMHGVLHPVTVLGALVFPFASLDGYVVAYASLATVGGAVLARSLGLSRPSSAVVGLGYGLSGYVLGASAILTYLSSSASAPWLLAAMRHAGKGTRFGIPAVAVATAVLLFSGDPQWTVVGAAMGLALAAEAGGVRGLARALGGLLLGTGLAAVQLLPAARYLEESSRAVPLGAAERTQWALSPWRLPEFLLPGLFGSLKAGMDRWPVFLWLGGPTQPGFGIPFCPSVTMGAAVVALAQAGARRSRTALLLACLCAGSFWLALGFHAGSEQVLHAVPVWGKFRYTEKFVGPLTLCVSLLAGFGCEWVGGNPSRKRATVVGIVGVVGVLAAVAGASLLALGALSAAACHSADLRRWFPGSAALLVFVSAAVASPFALRSGAAGVTDLRPLGGLRAEGQVTRVMTPTERSYRRPGGMAELDAQVAVQSAMGSPCYNVLSRIDQLDTYTGLRPRRLDELVRRLSDEFGPGVFPALRRFAVSDASIQDPQSEDEVRVASAASEGGTVDLVDRARGFMVWRLPHRPWATFAERVVWASGGEQALGALVEVLASGKPDVVVEGSGLPRNLPAGEVLSVKRGTVSVAIDAVAPADGLLVVNDAWWPGWKARIDGREVPVLRADFLVRAVPWPAGRHRLEMTYEPPELGAGKTVTFAAVAALLALAFAEHRAGRRRPAGSGAAGPAATGGKS